MQTDFLLVVLILFNIFHGSREMHCRALSVPARGKFCRETGVGMLPTAGTARVQSRQLRVMKWGLTLSAAEVM